MIAFCRYSLQLSAKSFGSVKFFVLFYGGFFANFKRFLWSLTVGCFVGKFIRLWLRIINLCYFHTLIQLGRNVNWVPSWEWRTVQAVGITVDWVKFVPVSVDHERLLYSTSACSSSASARLDWGGETFQVEVNSAIGRIWAPFVAGIWVGFIPVFVSSSVLRSGLKWRIWPIFRREARDLPDNDGFLFWASPDRWYGEADQRSP